MDTKQDFRQADACTRAVQRHPVTAGERQLHAAAQAKTVNETQRRTGQGFKSVKSLMHDTDDGQCLFPVSDPCEFLDVGTGDKPVCLIRQDYHTTGRILAQFGDNLTELLQDI